MARPRVIEEARILAAARTVFIAKGAEADTRLVAEAAGVSQAVLFQRYGTKKRLFFASMLPKPPDLSGLLGPTPANSEKAARAYLGGLASRLLAWLDDALPGSLRAALHPDFTDALTNAHAPTGAEAIQSAISDRLRTMQSAGTLHTDVDPDIVARTLLEFLHGQALVALLVAPEPVQTRAERCVALIWRGLAN